MLTDCFCQTAFPLTVECSLDCSLNTVPSRAQLHTLTWMHWSGATTLAFLDLSLGTDVISSKLNHYPQGSRTITQG